jgi:hypothetical protein
MKILICGDSFAADWTVKYIGCGWPNMLANKYQVTNLAQAGCSEYKILKQLESTDFNQYDRIIVSHTSPYRIYVERHPVHHNDPLHKDSDLIYSDLKEHIDTHPEVVPIIEYFEKYFSFEQAREMYNLLCEKIEHKLDHLGNNVIHVINVNFEQYTYQFKNMINFQDLFASNRGPFNHFDDYGNQQVFQKLVERLELR